MTRNITTGNRDEIAADLQKLRAEWIEIDGATPKLADRLLAMMWGDIDTVGSVYFACREWRLVDSSPRVA